MREDGKIWHQFCNVQRGEGVMNIQRVGQRDREGRSLVGPYPSHCSHVRLHLIGCFVVSLQEEDGRLDRPVRGYDLCEE